MSNPIINRIAPYENDWAYGYRIQTDKFSLKILIEYRNGMYEVDGVTSTCHSYEDFRGAELERYAVLDIKNGVTLFLYTNKGNVSFTAYNKKSGTQGPLVVQVARENLL